MKTPNEGEADPTTATEKSLYLVWEGWKIDLFITESGSLGITVDQPSPGMSMDPDAECPSVDVFVTPELEVSSSNIHTEETDRESEFWMKVRTYSDYHKDFYGCRPRLTGLESPKEIADRYDKISEEFARLKATRRGRDQLRSNSWIIPEACIHCGKPVEQEPSSGVWFHVVADLNLRFCSTSGTGSTAEPEPYEVETTDPKEW